MIASADRPRTTSALRGRALAQASRALVVIISLAGLFWLVVGGAGLEPQAATVAAWAGALLLAARLVGGISGWGFERRELLLIGALCFLSAWGWVAAHNAFGTYRTEPPRIEPLAGSVGWLPGSADGKAARQMMVQLGFPLAVAAVAAGLARFRRPRRALVLGSAAIGVVFATAGILGKLGLFTGAERDRSPQSPFAWFDFHGYAGSLLVVSTLVAGGTLWWVWQRSNSVVGRSIASGATLLCATGLALNVSEGAVLVAGVVAVGAGLAMLLRHGWRGSWAWAVGVSTSALGVLWITGAGGLLLAWLSRGGMRGRWLMWRSAAGIAGDAGIFGFGPGSFKLLLPQSEHLVRELYRSWIVTPYRPGEAVSFWSHACQDGLQTLVEWGWLGLCLWLSVFGTAVVRLMREAFRGAVDAGLAAGGAAALVGLLLHGMLDRPFQVLPVQAAAGLWVGLGWGWPTGGTPSAEEPHSDLTASRAIARGAQRS